MKIFVFSDTHGRLSTAEKALSLNEDANIIVFLGDGERDLEEMGYLLKGKNVIKVCGNCDRFSSLSDCCTFRAGNVKFYCTHGFNEKVKYGTSLLAVRAREAGCKVALYGHTHQKSDSTVDGIRLINPGSAFNGDYAVITVEGDEILSVEQEYV